MMNPEIDDTDPVSILSSIYNTLVDTIRDNPTDSGLLAKYKLTPYNPDESIEATLEWMCTDLRDFYYTRYENRFDYGDKYIRKCQDVLCKSNILTPELCKDLWDARAYWGDITNAENDTIGINDAPDDANVSFVYSAYTNLKPVHKKIPYIYMLTMHRIESFTGSVNIQFSHTDTSLTIILTIGKDVASQPTYMYNYHTQSPFKTSDARDNRALCMNTYTKQIISIIEADPLLRITATRKTLAAPYSTHITCSSKSNTQPTENDDDAYNWLEDICSTDNEDENILYRYLIYKRIHSDPRHTVVYNRDTLRRILSLPVNTPIFKSMLTTLLPSFRPVYTIIDKCINKRSSDDHMIPNKNKNKVAIELWGYYYRLYTLDEWIQYIIPIAEPIINRVLCTRYNICITHPRYEVPLTLDDVKGIILVCSRYTTYDKELGISINELSINDTENDTGHISNSSDPHEINGLLKSVLVLLKYTMIVDIIHTIGPNDDNDNNNNRDNIRAIIDAIKNIT